MNAVIPTIPTPDAPATDLVADWQRSIDILDRAMADAAAARLSLDAHQRDWERLESGHVLTVEGGNAETRKAKLTLALDTDRSARATVQAIAECKARLLDAERRVQVAKEQKRLYKALAALLAGGEEDR